MGDFYAFDLIKDLIDELAADDGGLLIRLRRTSADKLDKLAKNEFKEPTNKKETQPKGVIFISGKMRGLSDFGRKHFYEAASELMAKGWVVLNPAVLPIDMPDDRYMPICLAMLNSADAIYVLNNGHDSSGSRIELAYAKMQGKRVIYEGAKDGGAKTVTA